MKIFNHVLRASRALNHGWCRGCNIGRPGPSRTRVERPRTVSLTMPNGFPQQIQGHAICIVEVEAFGPLVGIPAPRPDI